MRASFAVDADKAEREKAADVRSSGHNHDEEFEEGAGDRPMRTMRWSAHLRRFVWWRYEKARDKWVPEGVEAAQARQLRVELSDEHDGRSVEEILAEAA